MLSKFIVSLFSFAVVFLYSVQAFALTSDLNYKYITENTDEFYKRGEMSLNFEGEIPDFLHDIYDLTPQTMYNSQFGTNIVLSTALGANYTTYAPLNAPVSFIVQSAAALIIDSTQDTFFTEAAEYQDYTSNDNPSYPLTPIAEVRNTDGSIGVLKIPKIGLTVTAYDGDTFTAMQKGIGHISSTSSWLGNIGLVGHNRGASDYFGKLKNLKTGDEITYSTKLGTRTYVVQSVQRIAETDWSYLQYTSDNRLTLLTCVEDFPSQRLCISATEKRR